MGIRGTQRTRGRVQLAAVCPNFVFGLVPSSGGLFRLNDTSFLVPMAPLTPRNAYHICLSRGLVYPAAL
uniref:Uncharacterized protein n=1 Tax=Steinernema glaseri TaxID=37863 RepID=A0A1I7ZTD9_9BILA